MPKTATKPKAVASPLTIVDLSLDPKQAYMILDLLYETAGLFPLDKCQELIEYIEDRLIDYNLPLSLDEFEGNPISPEFEDRKRVVLSFFDNNYQDDEEESEF